MSIKQKVLAELAEWEAQMGEKDAQLVRSRKPFGEQKIDVPVRAEKTILAELTPPTALSSPPFSEVDRKAKEKLADAEKEKGNALFKLQKYDQAVLCYSKAIEHCNGFECRQQMAIYYANRAMCFLKLKKWTEAECDCTLSIQQNEKYSKAFYRRASARIEQRKYTDAKKDYEAVLVLEPGNKQAVAELEKLKKIMNESSKQGRKVIKIKEIGALQEPPKMQTESGSNESKRKIDTETLLAPVDTEIKKPKSVEKVSEGEHQNEANALLSAEHSSNKTGRQETVSVPSNKEKTKPTMETTSTTTQPSQELKTALQKNVPMRFIKPKVPSQRPKSAFEFISDWNNLQDFDDLKCEYLIKCVAPENIGAIFKQCLTVEILRSIMKVVKMLASEQPQYISTFLSSLSTAGRFRMLKMLLNDEDKNLLEEIFNILESKLDSEKIKSIKQKYF